MAGSSDPQIHWFNDPSTYNLKIEGASAGDQLGGDFRNSHFMDVNGNGKPDLVLDAYSASTYGRVENGALYVIYDSLLQSLIQTKQTINLSDPTKYSLRFDGPKDGDNLAEKNIKVADFDRDGKPDLLVGSSIVDYNGSQSGSLYLVSGTILARYSGTGNNIDMASNNNFTIRYDGAAGGDRISRDGFSSEDFDNDGTPDIIVGAGHADNNGGNSGSAYFLRNGLIRSQIVTPTGNNYTFDYLGVTNYSFRIDGASANDVFSFPMVKDLDSDSKNETIISSAHASTLGRVNNGAIWVIDDTTMSGFQDGHAYNVGQPSTYNIEFDGPADNSQMYNLSETFDYDVDGDGIRDLFLSSSGYEIPPGSQGYGALYYVPDSVFGRSYSGHKEVDLLNANNYSLRINNSIAPGGVPMFSYADINNDSLDEILITFMGASSHGLTYNGSIYVLENSLFNSKMHQLGQTIEFGVNDTGVFSRRYDGELSMDELGMSLETFDINADGSQDILVESSFIDNNGATDAGAFYIILGFPHTISVNSSSLVISGNNYQISGTIDYSKSVTKPSLVEYKIGSGNWNNCIPVGGSFNGDSANFSCSFDRSFATSQQVTFRAIDTDGVITASVDQPTMTFNFPGSTVAFPNTGVGF